MKLNSVYLLCCLFAFGCSINLKKGITISKEEEMLRKRVNSDYQRPVYHATPPVYAMGDPNGLIQYKGVYHLFYQNHRPLNDSVSNTHWGHFTSKDLFHWKEQAVAISPEDPWKQCYSGSTVIFNDRPVAFFTGLSGKYLEVPCIAFSKDDDLNIWEQYKNNPIIAQRPEGLSGGGFRDPYTWKEGNRVFMALASSTKIGGAILLYSSEDLVDWEYQGPLYQGTIEPGAEGELFECPSFYLIGNGKYILSYNKLYSINGKIAAARRPVYMVGRYENYRFTPEYQADLDIFNESWAPQTFKDEKGRYIQFALSWCGRTDDAGWHGVQTMPRQVTMGEDNRLRFNPVNEHLSLLHNHRNFGGMKLTPSDKNVLKNLKGDCVKLRVVFEPGYDAIKLGVIVRKSDDGKEFTRIYYDTEEKRIMVDRTHGSAEGAIYKNDRFERGQVELSDKEPLVIEVFLDKSVIEVFVNEGAAAGITRVFPSKNSLGIDLFSEAGSAEVSSVEVWDIEL
jgi:beta-fructofuranosidase